VECARCGSDQTWRDGQTPLGGQRWRCRACRHRFTARSTSGFARRCFPDDLIALAVRWYVRFRLSFADVVEWLAERGVLVDRSTVYRWVQRFLPLFEGAARPHRRPIGRKWRVDETYVRLGGRWAYVYRAIDEDGQIVDVYFTERRNAAAAQAFFEQAIGGTGVTPECVTTDRAACYPPALRAVLPMAQHRQSKYLNNGIECDHGPFKQRLRPMRGFKRATSAQTLARGHALIQNLRRGFSALTAPVPRLVRLMAAWQRLAQAV
jgi:transposase-like protein